LIRLHAEFRMMTALARAGQQRGIELSSMPITHALEKFVPAQISGPNAGSVYGEPCVPLPATSWL
jgi:hypothetical protein